MSLISTKQLSKLLVVLTLTLQAQSTFAAKPSSLSGTGINPVVYPDSFTLNLKGSQFDLEKEDDRVKLYLLLEENQLTEKSKKTSNATKELLRLIAEYDELQSYEDRLKALVLMQEVGFAISSSKWTRSWPGFVNVPFLLAKGYELKYNSPGRKNYHRAENLKNHDQSLSDNSLVDPVESTFWKRPTQPIHSLNLFYGHNPLQGEKKELYLMKEINKDPMFACEYKKPKTGPGKNPGLDTITCDGKDYKVKFEEVHTTPISTRLQTALGFPAFVFDFVRDLPVKYDRKMLQEFNSRHNYVTKVGLVALPLLSLNRQKVFDPFKYLKGARLNDGSFVEANELKEKLFLNSEKARPYLEDANYSDFEQQVHSLVFKESVVRLRDGDGKSLGHWSWNALGHDKRRELRGFALLAGWLNAFDMRWRNNKLRLLYNEKTKTRQLVHMVSDMGSALGTAELTSMGRDMNLRAFPKTFTAGKTYNLHFGREYKPTLRIRGFLTNQRNWSFMRMDWDDARWMGRLIGQLTRKQIEDAVMVSGMTLSDQKLAVEKLISRRNKLIKDLELVDELSLL